MLGRYHYWRLHPFTLSETPKGISYDDAFRRLMTVGGFPEPFLDGGEVEARRWRRERLERITKDDIRDLEGIREIQTLSLLLDLLRERVGSLIVVSNLAAELQTAPKTVKHWIEALERMYVLFTVRPFTTNLPRAVQKPFKVYFFDNADVIGDEAARFENLVATHLLKHAHLLEDRDGLRYDLCFLRDKEGHEVDFAVIRERKLESLIEVKWADSNPTRSLSYFAEKLKAPRVIQLVAKLKESVVRGKLEVRTPREFLTRLPTRTTR